MAVQIPESDQTVQGISWNLLSKKQGYWTLLKDFTEREVKLDEITCSEHWL